MIMINNKIQMFKEYSEYGTTDLNEVNFLSKSNIIASFIKEVQGATIYKYKKTKELFEILVKFKETK